MIATVTMKKNPCSQKKHKHQKKQLPHLVSNQKPHKPFYGVGELYPAEGL
jgi:hypothetical protein